MNYETLERPRLGAIFLLGVVGIVLLHHYDPATSGIFPVCPLHYFTGMYCPGCGSLRAIHHLLHADWRDAWAMNPLTCLLLPFLGYGLLSEALSHFTGRELPQPFLRASAIRVLGAVIVLFGILRNLPIHPFDLLAPGAMLRIY